MDAYDISIQYAGINHAIALVLWGEITITALLYCIIGLNILDCQKRSLNRLWPDFKQAESLLADYGCLHFKFAILLGVSEPTYDRQEHSALKEADTKTVTFEGKEMAGYEAAQKQRKLETAARHAKDRQIIAEAAGDDTLRRQEQERINFLTSKYAALSKEAGLPTRRERLSVSKYRKVKTLDELKKPQKVV